MDINWNEEVEKRKSELIADLQKLLQIPSILNEKEAKAGEPFGPDVAKALQYMLELSQNAGFRTKNLEGFIGYSEIGEGEELVGILCHIDVVPVGEGWSVPPFSGSMVEDRIISRGAMDDKGPTLAAFYAAKIVKELGLPMKRRVRLIFGGDEESRWRCVDRYFQTEEMPTLGFAPDADFPLIHAEKGLYNLAIAIDDQLSKEGPIQLIQFNAGQRSNMVPDLAEVTLFVEDEGDMRSIAALFDTYIKEYNYKGSRKQDGKQITFTMEGISAHGSTPEKGVHAGWLLAYFIQRLELDERGEAFIEMLMECLVDDPSGAKLGIAVHNDVMGGLTVNAGVIQYPESMERNWNVALNIRYPNNTSIEELREKIRRRLITNGGKIVSESSSMVPHYVSKDHPLVETLLGIYRKHTGEATAEPIAIGGATYARSIKAGVAFGAAFPGREDVAHQKNEFILIDDLLKTTAIYAEAIYQLANIDLPDK